MDDERLVDEIARLWIALGGDAEGFEWLKEKIKQRIKELEEVEKGGTRLRILATLLGLVHVSLYILT